MAGPFKLEAKLAPTPLNAAPIRAACERAEAPNARISPITLRVLCPDNTSALLNPVCHVLPADSTA